jgi:pimeloyl-ACP methyl ester carboxylesterase
LSAGSVLVATTALLVMTVACSESALMRNEGKVGHLVVDGGDTLFYRTIGRGKDTAIVLHGGVGLHHGYLVEPLSALGRSHTLIFYDLRGRGRSSAVGDRQHLSLTQDIEDLESMRTHLGLEKVSLIAHHWGAPVAALYAARKPGSVQRLLLISPFPVHNALLFEVSFIAGDSARYTKALGHAGTRSVPDSMEVHCEDTWTLFFAPLRTHPDTPYDKVGRAVCDAPAGKLAMADEIRTIVQRGLGMWSWRSELNQIGVPVMVIEGEGDSVVAEAAVRWSQHIPDARVLMLPPPYLFPWEGDRMAFTDAMRGFLAGEFPGAAVKPPAWP